MAINQTELVQELMAVLEETFEQHYGIYLDKGTSLFQTLDNITHVQASRPVGGRCASIAAHVAHITFYLEVLERYFVANDTSKADWGAIWRTIEQVTPAQWDDLKTQLQLTYRRVINALRGVEVWQSDPHLASALAISVHTAYHLGEIRQACCTVN
jgi:hypothetical protein